MKKELATAIVQSFSQSAPRALLSRFSDSDWRSVDTWLNTSGMALYFLHRLKESGCEGSIPKAVLADLEMKAQQHKEQVDEQFAEFTAIVGLFQEHGLPFAVQKGYSLVPDYTPDPTLRLQMDFDFLVSSEAVGACNQLLLARGYELIFLWSDAYQGEWKFRKGETGYPTLSDLYRPKGEFTVEIHSRTAHPTLAPEILNVKELRGITFPALLKAEVFSEQCLHVYRHLQTEQTRLSWILEYRNFVRTNREDEDFWQEIRQRCARDASFASAFLLVTSFASQVFGEFAPDWFSELNARGLNEGVQKWLQRYAWDIALAKFPGTKLYLILERELSNDHARWQTLVRRAFLPSRITPPKVMASTNSGGRKRQYRAGRFRHAVARTEFHMREACRVSYEMIRWEIS
jgi:hypothetical protein